MPAPRGLVQQLDQRLHQSGLLPRNGRLLLAVSGGADSVALLRLLARINESNYWNWTLVVGHVDHGMRGKLSREDAVFVHDLAKSLGLPCTVRALKLKPATSEDIARHARLKALSAMMRKERCEGVVMAHHADDQAETLLMRIFRGCGLSGLAGMTPTSVVGGLSILRPLLAVRHSELLTYLRDIAQPWREDHTNASPQYLRNRVRHELLPLIESLWPQATLALGRLAILADETGVVVNTAVNGLMARSLIDKKPRTRIFSRKVLRRSSHAVLSELLRRSIEELGGTVESADFQRIREAMSLLRQNAGGKTLELGKGISVHLAGNDVTLHRHFKPRRRS